MKPALPPIIIPVFIPHAGCPHRCVFCNQHVVTGEKQAAWNADMVENAMDTYGDSLAGKKKRAVQIAFYGGNFLGLPVNTLRVLLSAAQHFVETGQVNGIRFSTRPDTVSDDRIALVKKYTVATVEIGAQSMSDDVLATSRRGHDANQTALAVSRLKENGFETGVQMMVGLPGDTDATVLESGEAITALAPDFVRIYPTVVLAGSLLGKWYRSDRYSPLSLERAVSLTKNLWILFDQAGIPVIRMGLPASAELENSSTLLAGPYHPAFGHLVYEALIFDAICDSVKTQAFNESVDIYVHPRNLSKVTGIHSGNRKRLVAYFHPRPVNLISDKTIAIDQLIVNRQPCRLYGERLPGQLNGATA